MRQMGLQRVVRGKAVRTTISNPAVACPLGRVSRQFRAPRPNALWLSDFAYVATSTFRAAKSPGPGFVYVAFVVEPIGSPDIDAYARRIVGWQVSRTAHAGFVLDALEQALAERRPIQGSGLVHYSDRSVQYVLVRYMGTWPKRASSRPLAASATATTMLWPKSINGLCKAKVIYRQGPWHSLEAIEFATPGLGRVI